MVKHQLLLGAHDLYIAEIVAVQYDEEVLDERGHVRTRMLTPIAFMDGEYWSLGERMGIYGGAAKASGRRSESRSSTSMRFYITTPIYYVNSEPHHGHAYTTIAADVLARYHRQRGEDVFFLTGVDEHGTKIAQAADERGLTPQQHVDQMAPKYRDLAAAVNASNDFFIRTTDPEHETFVQGFVEKLKAAGDIEKRAYGGLYCTGCEGFWYERDLTPDGMCPHHGIKPVWLEEENYYFLLSKYQDRLAGLLHAPTPAS